MRAHHGVADDQEGAPHPHEIPADGQQERKTVLRRAGNPVYYTHLDVYKRQALPPLAPPPGAMLKPRFLSPSRKSGWGRA